MGTEINNKVFTIPNLLTLLRLLLLPVYLILLVGYQNSIAAFFVFAIAASTDFVDGAVARHLNQISKLGQQFDPLVDRFLIVGGVIGVFAIGRVPLWILLFLILRDLVMFILTIYQMRRFNKAFEVIFPGKITTVFVLSGFCLLIIGAPLLPGLGIVEAAFLPGWGQDPAFAGMWLLYIGTVFSLVTAFLYIRRCVGYAKQEQRNYPVNTQFSQAMDAYIGTSQAQGAARPAVRTTYASNRQSTTVASTLRATPAPSRVSSSQKAKTRKANAAHAKRHAATRPKRSLASIINTPLKLRLTIALVIIVVVFGGFYLFDGIRTFGVIHQGVSVAGIDVGGMTTEEAADLLETELSERARTRPVYLYDPSVGDDVGSTRDTADLTQGVTAYEEENSSAIDASSWSISTATLSATVDGEALANQAFAVGRGSDFLFGRPIATFFGVSLKGSMVYAPPQLESLERILTNALGWPLVEGSITSSADGFTVDGGKDGYIVEHESFIQSLDEAFLSDSRNFVVNMVEVTRQIDEQAAQLAREQALAATQESVELIAEDTDTRWVLASNDLRLCVATRIDTSGDKPQLIPYIDEKKLKENLESVIGTGTMHAAPIEAQFKVDEDGTLYITQSSNGLGIDYVVLTQKLNAITFEPLTQGDVTSVERSVVLPIGVLYPELSTEEAEAMNITDKIATFTTEYWWVSAERIHNIHLASDFATSSTIASGEVWSFNETVGDCNEERGFQQARGIVENEFVDAIGGGVCQVATTIFNAVFESGLPIEERTNHALYVDYCPDGRDAAISWPSVDLKFKNDTSGWMILTLEYTSYSVTATLWGSNPDYVVEINTSDWIAGPAYDSKEEVNPEMFVGEREVITEGEDGKSISVQRIVYDQNGVILRDGVFRSTYSPITEVIEYGVKEKPS